MHKRPTGTSLVPSKLYTQPTIKIQQHCGAGKGRRATWKENCVGCLHRVHRGQGQIPVGLDFTFHESFKFSGTQTTHPENGQSYISILYSNFPKVCCVQFPKCAVSNSWPMRHSGRKEFCGQMSLGNEVYFAALL